MSIQYLIFQAGLTESDRVLRNEEDVTREGGEKKKKPADKEKREDAEKDFEEYVDVP